MSYVQSNLCFEPQCRHYTAEEAAQLTEQEFDRLPLSDHIYLYNNHPNEYARLSGRPYEQTEANTPPVKSKEQLFAEAFEKAVDDAFIRVCGHKAGES